MNRFERAIEEITTREFCEKCWGEAHLVTHGHATETQTDAYFRLRKKCKHNLRGATK